MGETRVTLATGRELTVALPYADARAYLAPRTLTDDDGRREVLLADGREATIAIGAIVAVEEAADNRVAAVGFR